MPKISEKFQRSHPNGGTKYRLGSSNGDFLPISRFISETVQSKDIVIIEC